MREYAWKNTYSQTISLINGYPCFYHGSVAKHIHYWIVFGEVFFLMLKPTMSDEKLGGTSSAKRLQRVVEAFRLVEIML